MCFISPRRIFPFSNSCSCCIGRWGVYCKLVYHEKGITQSRNLRLKLNSDESNWTISTKCRSVIKHVRYGFATGSLFQARKTVGEVYADGILPYSDFTLVLGWLDQWSHPDNGNSGSRAHVVVRFCSDDKVSLYVLTNLLLFLAVQGDPRHLSAPERTTRNFGYGNHKTRCLPDSCSGPKAGLSTGCMVTQWNWYHSKHATGNPWDHSCSKIAGNATKAVEPLGSYLYPIRTKARSSYWV